MRDIVLTNAEYISIQKLLFNGAGISLGDNKRTLVKARLLKRLYHYKVASYADYLKIVQISKTEHTEFINQMSANETYFFREKEHFVFLEDLCKKKSFVRIWSAAASQGAEAYSAAMIAEDSIKNGGWEVIGSDINTRVLDIAKKGLYPFSWIEKIPTKYRSKNCLKGIDSFEGKFLINPTLTSRVSFLENNLIRANKELGMFDVIFLRNVLLYFNEEVKLRVIKNVISNLKSGGYLIIGLTELFKEICIDELSFVGASIYRKD